MITLHHCHQTRSMRTLWLLGELGVNFKLVVYPFDQTLKSDQYLTVHPVGRVPALQIDGEIMFESGAITEYLCERFPAAGMGRLPGDPDRMDWLNWVHFAETISQHVASLTQQHIALFNDDMRSPVVMKIEAKRLKKCFAAIEARLDTPVEQRDYLLTSGFSAADISVGQAVYMARHFAKIEPFEKLGAWYARITDRDAFKAALPPSEGRLYTRDFYPVWADV